MAKNQKYSHNGYDPTSPRVIDAKAKLKADFESKKISFKQYSAGVSNLKKGWKNKSLLTVPSSDFNDSEIVGTDFCQLEPFTNVFPADITGVMFVRCNLNNVNIPAGATLENCVNKHFEEQNDLEYWEVNAGRLPLRPLSEKEFDFHSLSKDPRDLPAERAVEARVDRAERERKKAIMKQRVEFITKDPVRFAAWLEKGGSI